MNLLFDLDGTLADPFVAFQNSLDYGFKKNHLEAPTEAQIRRAIGPPLQTSLESIFGLPSSLASKVMADYRGHHAENCVSQYQFYSGAREALTFLKTEHRLFVATSKPHAFAIPILKNFNFDGFFDKIYGSELSGIRSSKTDLISYILSEEKLKAGETIMIGDREHDALGARNNKILAVGVLWGFGPLEELEKAGTVFQASSWQGLVDYIGTLSPSKTL